jgi:hypothetical protein
MHLGSLREENKHRTLRYLQNTFRQFKLENNGNVSVQ